MHSITPALVLVALASQLAQQGPVPSLHVKEHLRQVSESLPSGSVLRTELAEGVHGDGVHYPWMDEMKRDGIKRIEIEIHLDWFFGPRFTKVVRVMYFANYEGSETQITAPEKIKSFQTSGFEQELRRVALDRARHGMWFENPAHQIPPHLWFMPAAIEIELLDDPWLPISTPLYWDYDASWTPLVDAVAMGDRFGVMNLLSEEKPKTSDLDRALIWAAAGDDPRTLQDLLKAGARVNSKDKEGRTPIFATINNLRTVNAKILLEAGADVNVRSRDTGDTPLTSSLYGQVDASEMVNLLLSSGANPNIGNEFGRTPLMLATFGQPVAVLDTLLKAGAAVNAQSKDGDTALMIAAGDNNIDAVRTFLRYHPNRDVKNSRGETAFSIALAKNHRQIAELLTP